MTRHRNYFLLLITCLFLSSCIRTTYFSNVKNSRTVLGSDYTFDCYIQNEPSSLKDQLIVAFDHCTYETSLVKCTDKKLLKNSLNIEAYFLKNRKPMLFKQYASRFWYSDNDFDELVKENTELVVNISFKVDSLGTILNKKDKYLLKKDTEWRTHFALH